MKAFFSVDVSLPTEESNTSLLSPTALLSPDRGTFADQRSFSGSDYGGRRDRSASIISAIAAADSIKKEERASSDAIWKQIMDPILGYCEVRLVDALPCGICFTS